MSRIAGRNRWHLLADKIIIRPAREDDDLKLAGLVPQQRPEPLHSQVVALHQLIIEHNRAAEIFGKG